MSDPYRPVVGIKTRSRWGCLTAFLIFAVPYALISRLVSPSDWVDVTVGPLGKGSENFCLIAEDSQGVSALPWYHSKVIPFTDDPCQGGTLNTGFRGRDHDGLIQANFQWREARRYGVLIHRRDNQWRLWWLEPSDMRQPSLMRHVFGGGQADVHVPAEALAAIPSRLFLEQLGLSNEKNP